MSAKTVRLTMAQALIKYLTCQYTERDGDQIALFAGCFGIFGHGCVSGIGQALQQYPQFRYYQTRNEQAMVHASAAYAKMKNRMQTFFNILNFKTCFFRCEKNIQIVYIFFTI